MGIANVSYYSENSIKSIIQSANSSDLLIHYHWSSGGTPANVTYSVGNATVVYATQWYGGYYIIHLTDCNTSTSVSFSHQGHVEIWKNQ